MLFGNLAVLRLVFDEVQVSARLTHPSSGRATAGFAHRVPPLMSNVRLQMRLSQQQAKPEALAALAMEVCELVKASNFSELAEKFGYAIALGRTQSIAIEEDLNASLVHLGNAKLDQNAEPEVRVKYFEPAESNLYALAEFSLATTGSRGILVELVICHTRNEFHATLEQISAAAV